MDDKEEDSCPICFLTSSLLISSGIPLVQAPCGHKACKECLEKIILKTKQGGIAAPRSINEEDEDEALEAFEEEIIEACPTRGKCPICRSYIDMFQLVLHRSNEVDDLTFAYGKNTDIARSPIGGMQFIALGDDIDQCSFHFPSIADPALESTKDTKLKDEVANGQTESEGKTNSDIIMMPFCRFDNCDASWKLDNGKELPLRKEFEEGCHFHEQSNTFHGTIDWTKGDNGGTWNGAGSWEIIMQFSSDFRYISRGGIIKRRNQSKHREDEKDSWFPLDGIWLAEWKRRHRYHDDEEDPVVSQVKVIANTVYLSGLTSVINLGREGDKSQISFLWPRERKQDGSRYKQVLESGLDLNRNKLGPAVGEIIVWTVDHPDYYNIIWKRKSVGSLKLRSTFDRFGKPNNFYKRLQSSSEANLSSSRPLPTFHEGTLWGNVFVQFFKVGYASYHFISHDGNGEGGAYISYEHPDCEMWPSLDNGSPVPARVPFVRYSFDAETRTFHGTIPWMEVYSTTWQGSSSWKYEIVFDTEFTCILSGKVNSVDGNNTEVEMSSYGESLNYINAALTEKLTASMRNTDQQDENESGLQFNSSSVMRVRAELRRRLQNEGASMRTISIVQKVFHGSLLQGVDTIDFNIW